MIQGWNGYVAVAPFARPREQTQSVTGLVRQAERGALVEVRVVYGTLDVPAGSRAWVRAEIAVGDGVKQVLRVEGQDVVLLPVAELRLVDRPLFGDVMAGPILTCEDVGCECAAQERSPAGSQISTAPSEQLRRA